MLDKSIRSGKDHRQLVYYKPRKSSNFDLTCRPHGGCPYCENNRLHQSRKRISASDRELREVKKYGYEADLHSQGDLNEQNC